MTVRELRHDVKTNYPRGDERTRHVHSQSLPEQSVATFNGDTCFNTEDIFVPADDHKQISHA